jgi:hypothetical protein
MRPTQHPSNNTVLRPPPGATIEECTPLPITRRQYANGQDVVLSYWRPSDAERKAIAEGALIEFHAWGRTHPPVFIGVEGVAAE